MDEIVWRLQEYIDDLKLAIRVRDNRIKQLEEFLRNPEKSGWARKIAELPIEKQQSMLAAAEEEAVTDSQFIKLMKWEE